MTPLFLSLDGLDGCGKSTQTRLLASWLRSLGHDVVECRDPGGTTAGDRIRSILLDGRDDLSTPCELFLFMASRAQLVHDVIRPALDSGKIVICDRFLLANVVYQGHAGGLDPESVWRIGETATGGLHPQRTFVLDLPVEEAWRRRDKPADRIEQRTREFHDKVRAGFLAEAKRRPDAICVLDATEAVDAVHQKIRDNVTKL